MFFVIHDFLENKLIEMMIMAENYLDFRAFCSRVKTNRTTKFTTMLRDWKGWLRQKSMEGLMIRFLITQREDFPENDAYLKFDFSNLLLTRFIELFE